ncbi:MAG: molybdopterin-dependent oxidoreductase [Actinobacteria bacterium]|nr:molybdopterin-dependent oxidoreductase [Actinomycetota bacterium]MBW3647442.1 molybdopterin-dependent oxidoreductase [Actinomycetota bacterium]
MTSAASWHRQHPPGRRTNLALLALIALAFLTGTVSFAVGSTPATTAVTFVHAAVGLALVLLVPWKSVIVRRGLRRPMHAGRAAGITLVALVAVTVAAGVGQAVLGWTATAVTPVQVHVAAALLVVPLLVAHMVTHWQRPRRADVSRRGFLAAGLIAAGGVASALAVQGVTRGLGLPAARARGTGSTERGSFSPELMPVTQWFTDEVPPLESLDVPLRVVVDGRAVAVDLQRDATDAIEALLDCTGGWYATQRWRGVRLDRLLPVPLPPAARSIEVVSITGYRRRFPIDDASTLLLATTVEGRPLSPGHGFPRRLVAPGRRGFWWVKWVVAVEVTDRPALLQPPFPLQ